MTGCMPWATSTTMPSSPTRASTRPASPAPRSPPGLPGSHWTPPRGAPTRSPPDYQAVPQVFFRDPSAGAVGLTADQAERAGHHAHAPANHPAYGPRSAYGGQEMQPITILGGPDDSVVGRRDPC